MYIVIDRQTKSILHVNRAPFSQDLSQQEVYHRFDGSIMQIGKTDATELPEYYSINEQGEIVEMDLEEQVRKGYVKLEPHQKVLNGEVVNKNTGELVADGLLEPGITQKIVNDEIVMMSTEEQVRKGLIPFDRTRQKIENSVIVDITPEELLRESTISVKEYRANHIRRLRKEVEEIYNTRLTPSGYSMDTLARQKLTLSIFFRSMDENDPTKAELMERRAIYPDFVIDEISMEIEKIQKAFDQAKARILNASGSTTMIQEVQSTTVNMFLNS